MRNLSSLIKQKAQETGFDLCGIARYRQLKEYEVFLKAWVGKGMNDKMSYLGRNIGKRTDPANLFPGAKSLVITGLSYYSEVSQRDHDAPILSRYAYGRDYHAVLFEKLGKLLDWIKGMDPKADGRIFADSAPLLEKPWASEAGLGWQGRHSVLINKDIGSFFFIGTVILNIELEYDDPVRKEYCGTCRLCIEACPTGAINENRTIDARRCIANLTIENRGPIPDELLPFLGRRIYGCDVCQEVCPWNKKAIPGKVPEFRIRDEIADMSLEDWINLTEERFRILFKGTAVERVRYEQFKRNIQAVTGTG